HVDRGGGDPGEDRSDDTARRQGLASAGAAVAAAFPGEAVHGSSDEQRSEAPPEGERLGPVQELLDQLGTGHAIGAGVDFDLGEDTDESDHQATSFETGEWFTPVSRDPARKSTNLRGK